MFDPSGFLFSLLISLCIHIFVCQNPVFFFHFLRSGLFFHSSQQRPSFLLPPSFCNDLHRSEFVSFTLGLYKFCFLRFYNPFFLLQVFVSPLKYWLQFIVCKRTERKRSNSRSTQIISKTKDKKTKTHKLKKKNQTKNKQFSVTVCFFPLSFLSRVVDSQPLYPSLLSFKLHKAAITRTDSTATDNVHTR